MNYLFLYCCNHCIAAAHWIGSPGFIPTSIDYPPSSNRCHSRKSGQLIELSAAPERFSTYWIKAKLECYLLFHWSKVCTTAPMNICHERLQHDDSTWARGQISVNAVHWCKSLTKALHYSDRLRIYPSKIDHFCAQTSINLHLSSPRKPMSSFPNLSMLFMLRLKCSKFGYILGYKLQLKLKHNL